MIGIYGGTFDPIHYGHLRTALEVKAFFSLDEIRLIPCAKPAHKALPNTHVEHRLEMLGLAIQGQTGLLIDERELNRPGISFMIDTLKSIRKEIAHKPLLLFMGADAFKGITTWHQWQYLFDYAHIVVMTRPGYEQDTSQQYDDFLKSKLSQSLSKLQSKPAGYLFFQQVTQLDISATAIRKIVGSGMNPSFLLPEKVIDYIKQNKLYTVKK